MSRPHPLILSLSNPLILSLSKDARFRCPPLSSATNLRIHVVPAKPG